MIVAEFIVKLIETIFATILSIIAGIFICALNLIIIPAQFLDGLLISIWYNPYKIKK